MNETNLVPEAPRGFLNRTWGSREAHVTATGVWEHSTCSKGCWEVGERGPHGQSTGLGKIRH